MRARKSKHRFLTLDELSPTIHFATCFKWKRERNRYRIPSHHILFIESGKLDAKIPGSLFPINTHLLPPEAGSNWRVRYLPRKCGRDYVMTVPADRK